MKNKKFRIITVALLVFLFISACSTTEEMKDHQNSSTISIIPESSQAVTSSNSYQAILSDKLKVNAIVNSPKTDSFPSLSVQEKKFDETKVVHTFFNNQQASLEQRDGISRYISSEAILDISSSGYIRYNTNLGQYIKSVFNSDSNKDKKIFTEKELSGLSCEKAIEQAAMIIEELGITPHLPPQIYSLDSKSLQKKQDLLTQDEDYNYFVEIGKTKLKDQWTEEDESYYMVFDIESNGLPISSESYAFKNSEVAVEGSRVTVIVSKAGVQSLEVDGVIYEELEKKQPETLIPMAEALESLKQKYEKIILNEELTVKRISLVYVPVITGGSTDKQTGEIINKEMELIPAWSFSIDLAYVKDGQEFTHTTVVQINAVTGKEIS
ncbi:hypothetical protein [Clostridium minihomine]|uniref:hypothetical protein n=1 Tax=Clostridium minihomine TaxID=2045012 RepID=UPI000C7644C5|nr:hypothetical protein [Clostridium minihomine]